MRQLGDLTCQEALEHIPGEEQEQLIQTFLCMKENVARACRTLITQEDTIDD